MKKLHLLIFLGIFVSHFLFSQNVDSLKQVLPLSEGLERAESLIKLAKLSGRSNSESEKRIEYAEEVIRLAEEVSDSSLLADAYYQIGEANYFLSKHARAVELYKKAVNIYKENGDSVSLGDSYNSIGACFDEMNEFEKAIEHFHKSIKILDFLGKSELAADAYNNLANLYQKIQDYDRAIDFYQKALLLNESINNINGIAANYNGLGTSFFFHEKYDSAKVYYEFARNSFEKSGQRRNVAISLNNIANVHVNKGDSLYLALQYYQDAIDIFHEIDDQKSEVHTLNGLAGVYWKLNMIEEATKTYENAINFCLEHCNDYSLLRMMYDDLAFLYEDQKDYKRAYEALNLYTYYNDSVFEEQRIKEIAELGEKFETEKKEAEIVRLTAIDQVQKLQIQRDKQIRLFGAVIIVLFIVITLVILVGYITKKRNNELLTQKNIKIELQRKELEKLNASKNKFFSIIAHDLKNPFHTVMGYSYLMHKDYNRFNDDERKKYAGDIYRSTNTIFRLLQNLLDWSRSQTGRISVNPQQFLFCELYENIKGVLNPVAEAKKVKLVHCIEEGSNAFADPMMVETILRNLINNAIKFSYEGGIVETTVCQENEHLKICVKDSGTGIKQNDLENLFRIDSKVKQKGTKNEDGSGLGLILCKEFVEKNGGCISAESEPGNGSCFCVTLPKVSLS